MDFFFLCDFHLRRTTIRASILYPLASFVRHHHAAIQNTCFLKEGQCGSYPSTANDSSYYPFWVKSYCTMTSLTFFTLYFPYILLLSALALGTNPWTKEL